MGLPSLYSADALQLHMRVGFAQSNFQVVIFVAIGCAMLWFFAKLHPRHQTHSVLLVPEPQVKSTGVPGFM